MIKVRYMGDNLAIITPTKGESMEDIIKLNKEWFKIVFEVVDSWAEAYAADHKIVCVRCYDIPITLWNKDCFAKVVGEVASLVKVDETTEKWEKLEYARIQVRFSKHCSSRMAKRMQINGQILSTCIEEDKPSDYGGHCQCQCNHDASSDSVSSSETYVEDTFCRGSRCAVDSGFGPGEK